VIKDLHFMPPEILICETSNDVANQSSAAVDMWALGCIVFQLLTGYHPFAEDCRIAILYRIFKTLGTPAQNILQFPTLLSNEEFVEMMSFVP
jgi:serine/threonine protein kinase